jgi:hypothetical protein
MKTMGGLKIWIILSTMLLLGACVPQAKFTSCTQDEAFSPTLRTCVPVVPGSDSFIQIEPLLPTTSISRYQHDQTDIDFRVRIINPFNQDYRIKWFRIHGAQTPYEIPGAISDQYAVRPSNLALAGGVGTYLIQVQVTANGKVAASHSFEVLINNTPKPTIDVATINPASWLDRVTPGKADCTPGVDANCAAGEVGTLQPATYSYKTYSFEIQTNGADLTNMDYRTEWRLTRNNFHLSAWDRSIPFSSNTTARFDFPTSIGLGSYALRARIRNNVETVAEYSWYIIVGHPPHTKITARNIYATPGVGNYGSPSFAEVVRVFHEIPYTDFRQWNFVPRGQTEQAQFCVTFENWHGAYDNQGMEVSFLVNDDALIGTVETHNGTGGNVACMSDLAILANAVFLNPGTQPIQRHLYARVKDKGTELEYKIEDINPLLGGYPIRWNIEVRPQNQPPSVTNPTALIQTNPNTSTAFNTGCTLSTSNSNTMENCRLWSDTNFTVNINFDHRPQLNVLGDDFHYDPFQENMFNYSIRLYRDGVEIQRCNKTTAGSDGQIDLDGTNGYSCVLNIPSYLTNGPFDVTQPNYQIQAQIFDLGSPISGTSAYSRTLIWNVKANERNTSLSILSNLLTSNGTNVATPVSEGSALQFNFQVSDNERDNFSYQIQYCHGAGCNVACNNDAPFTNFQAGSVTRTSDDLNRLVATATDLPEDFLWNVPSCLNLDRDAVCQVNFRVRVTDIPNNTTNPPLAAALTACSDLATVYIRNTNPAPTITRSMLAPDPVTEIRSAFVGHPLSLSASGVGAIVDSSLANREKVIENNRQEKYQWYAATEAAPTTWIPIPGATAASLIYTPSIADAANSPIRVMFCVEDRPATLVPTPTPLAITGVHTASVCSSQATSQPWMIHVNNNLRMIDEVANTPEVDPGKKLAVWYKAPETYVNGLSFTTSVAYVAMVENNSHINVKKIVVRNNGEMDIAAPIVRFSILPGGTPVSEIRDLSIVGNNDQLYIAYLASRSTGTQALHPQVRRIDLSRHATMTNNKIFDATENRFGEPSPFGFAYNGISITQSCDDASKCVITNAGLGIDPSIQFVPSGSPAGITGTVTITSPAGSLIIPFEDSPNSVGTICSDCIASQMALDLASIINRDHAHLKGIRATAVGDRVTIYGSPFGDYFDSFAASSVSRSADGLGSIFIHGSNWYLPFINNSLGGSFNDTVSFYYGATGFLGSATPGLIESTVQASLAIIPAASSLSTYYQGNELMVALVQKFGSTGYVTKLALADFLNAAGPAPLQPQTINKQLTDIQISASAERVYVGAEVTAPNDLHVGIYQRDNLNNGQKVFMLSDQDVSDNDTRSIFRWDNISSYQIIPYGVEARIAAVSKDSSNQNRLYMGRLTGTQTAGILKFSCGSCEMISNLSSHAFENVQLAATPVVIRPTASDELYRLAPDGAITNQGIRDTVVLAFGQTEIGENPAVARPYLGIFNVMPEAIPATLLHGSSGSANTGLFRPPFVSPMTE